MKNKKIVYRVYNDEKMCFDLVVVNVVDEKLTKLLNSKNKRLITIDGVRLQVLSKEEFSDHDRYYLYSYDMNKTNITCFINSALIVDSIMKRMMKLNEMELIDFHDELYDIACGEYDEKMSQEDLYLEEVEYLSNLKP